MEIDDDKIIIDINNEEDFEVLTDYLDAVFLNLLSKMKEGSDEYNFVKSTMDFFSLKENKIVCRNDPRVFERQSLEYTSEALYRLITTNFVTVAVAVRDDKSKTPSTLSEISNDMFAAYDKVKTFKVEFERLNRENPKEAFKMFKSYKYSEAFMQLVEFLDVIMPFFETIKKVDKIILDKSISDKEFYRIIVKQNIKLLDILQKANDKIGTWPDINEVFDLLYQAIRGDFSDSAQTIYFKGVVQYNTERVANIQVRKVEPVINEKEQERLSAISRANALYDELCLDFMRDLEKQYSHSVKDMYDYFVNVKFKKFTERYPMPIDNNVSVGYAVEVASQIKSLMEYVSKISENAYTTSVFGN